MYDNYKLYGPYDHSHRLRLVIVDKTSGKKTSISYAKYLMELHLGRHLKSYETVDHIDNDYTNNDLSNLRVLSRREHSLVDALRNNQLEFKCEYCGKVFLRKKRGNRHGHGYFCSKQCSGKYGKLVQEGKIKPKHVITKVYPKYRLKWARMEK